MSDVERFWAAIQSKMPGCRDWKSLDPMEQMQVVQAINFILQVASQR